MWLTLISGSVHCTLHKMCVLSSIWYELPSFWDFEWIFSVLGVVKSIANFNEPVFRELHYFFSRSSWYVEKGWKRSIYAWPRIRDSRASQILWTRNFSVVNLTESMIQKTLALTPVPQWQINATKDIGYWIFLGGGRRGFWHLSIHWSCRARVYEWAKEEKDDLFMSGALRWSSMAFS